MFTLPCRGRVDAGRAAGWGSLRKLRACVKREPTRLAALATLPLQGRVRKRPSIGSLPYGGFALIFPKSCSRFPAAVRGENGVIREDLRRWGRNFAPIYFSFTTGMLSRNPAA